MRVPNRGPVTRRPLEGMLGHLRQPVGGAVFLGTLEDVGYVRPLYASVSVPAATLWVISTNLTGFGSSEKQRFTDLAGHFMGYLWPSLWVK